METILEKERTLGKDMSKFFFDNYQSPKCIEDKYQPIYNKFIEKETFDLEISDFFTPFCKAVIFEKGLFGEKIDHKKAFEYYKKDFECVYSLHILALKQNKKEVRETLYKKILEIEPKFYPALNNLGTIYYENKNSKEAMYYYKKAQEILPNDPMIKYNMGLVHDILLKEHSRAIQLYKEVLEINENHYESLYNLAVIYLESYSFRNIDTCHKYIKKAIKMSKKLDDELKDLIDDFNNELSELRIDL